MTHAKLTVNDLYSLEEYAKRRTQIRRQVMAEKSRRQLALGEHARLTFESRVTMLYQVQEMLRVERIFEQQGICEELDAYNSLIPDGDNFKATLMLQYEDVAVRRRELARLIGIEGRVWVRVAGHEQVFAIADEDMERATEQKTSSVHFLRFQLSDAMCSDLCDGAALAAGIDHEHYKAMIEPLPERLALALREDVTA